VLFIGTQFSISGRTFFSGTGIVYGFRDCSAGCSGFAFWDTLSLNSGRRDCFAGLPCGGGGGVRGGGWADAFEEGPPPAWGTGGKAFS
jgi:hypothetical protein